MDLKYLDLAYLAASALLVLWFVVEIAAHRYHSSHQCTNYRRFGSFQIRYQRCGFVGALLILGNALFVFNNWSKLGNVGYFYLLRDHCNFVIIFAAYITIYEVFTVCHRQLYECEKPQLTQAFAYFFVSSFFVSYFSVLGIDLWVTAQDYSTDNENHLRAYVCLIYTCVFSAVLALMVWVDYDVKRTFTKVFPGVLEVPETAAEASTPTTHLLRGEHPGASSANNAALESSVSRRVLSVSSQITHQEEGHSSQHRVLSKSEISISTNQDSQSLSADARLVGAASLGAGYSKIDLPSSASASTLARSASVLARSASMYQQQVQEKLPRDPTTEFAIHVLQKTMKRVLWLARITQFFAATGMVFELSYGILLFIKFYLNNQTESYKNEFTYSLTWLQFCAISVMAKYGWIPLRHEGGGGSTRDNNSGYKNNSGGNKTATVPHSPSMIEAMFIPSGSTSQTWGEQHNDTEGGRSFQVVHE